MTDFVHYRENNEDTQRHLDENRATFESDCMYLLRLMNMGKRLSRQQVSDMHINERRLGELHEDGKCKREWMFRELPNGKKKRTHVEYFIPIPKPPTKGQVIAMYKQKELFE